MTKTVYNLRIIKKYCMAKTDNILINRKKRNFSDCSKIYLYEPDMEDDKHIAYFTVITAKNIFQMLVAK